MLSTLWNTILVTPLFNVMVIMNALTGNMGVAIILFTLIARGITIPFAIPSMKSMNKQRELQPEIDKLRKKYKQDKQKMAEEQMKLFQKHGINPASGCFSQILMIVLIFAIYGVISKFTRAEDLMQLNSLIYFDSLKFSTETLLNTHLGWFDVTKSDPLYILAIFSGLLQLINSKMLQPYVEEAEKAAQKTTDKKDDFAYNMQQQMLYTMPIMSVIIGVTLPSGVVLYIVTSTVVSIVQTYFISGLGGLKSWFKKFGLYRKKAKI